VFPLYLLYPEARGAQGALVPEAGRTVNLSAAFLAGVGGRGGAVRLRPRRCWATCTRCCTALPIGRGTPSFSSGTFRACRCRPIRGDLRRAGAAGGRADRPAPAARPCAADAVVQVSRRGRPSRRARGSTTSRRSACGLTRRSISSLCRPRCGRIGWAAMRCAPSGWTTARARMLSLRRAADLPADGDCAGAHAGVAGGD
jgi:hypothetical protein